MLPHIWRTESYEAVHDVLNDLRARAIERVTGLAGLAAVLFL
jgi:hypothetical protein